MPLITFRSTVDSTDPSFSLTMLDDRRFRAAALDHRWRPVFTRQ